MQEKVSKDKRMYNYLEIKDKIIYNYLYIFCERHMCYPLCPYYFWLVNRNSKKVCSGELQVKEV